MVRARTGHKRCKTCRLHPSVCLCEQLPQLATRTAVSIVIWHQEQFKTTNTGMLTLACLSNSSCCVYAGPEPMPEQLALAGEQALLLFPAEDAVPLSNFTDAGRPLRLIVPDGTWRQAAKMSKRIPALAGMPRVFLPEGPNSRYTVRTSTRKGSVCTMEAIARALGELEGPETRAGLEHVFHMFIDRLNWIRGTLPADQVYGGLPERALRHDPHSGVTPC